MSRATWGTTDLGGTIGTLHAGAKLRVAHWTSAQSTLGTVILVQGRAETMEFYAETIADLRDRGYHVVAFDFRGQGGSERRTKRGGHVRSFRQYQDDLCAVVRFAADEGLPRPFTVLAHSTGGLVALNAQNALKGEIARMVLFAPLLDLGETRLPMGGMRLLAFFGALLGFSRSLVTRPSPPPTPAGFAANKLTSDPNRYQALCTFVGDNPDLATGPPTFGWMNSAFHAMGRARRRTGKALSVPTLFVASAADKVVSTAAIARFARAAMGGGLVLIPDARHQVLFERDGVRAMALAAFNAFAEGSAAGDVDNGERRALQRSHTRRTKFVIGAQRSEYETPQPAPAATLPDGAPMGPPQPAEPQAGGNSGEYAGEQSGEATTATNHPKEDELAPPKGAGNGSDSPVGMPAPRTGEVADGTPEASPPLPNGSGADGPRQDVTGGADDVRTAWRQRRKHAVRARAERRAGAASTDGAIAGASEPASADHQPHDPQPPGAQTAPSSTTPLADDTADAGVPNDGPQPSGDARQRARRRLKWRGRQSPSTSPTNAQEARAATADKMPPARSAAPPFKGEPSRPGDRGTTAVLERPSGRGEAAGPVPARIEGEPHSAHLPGRR